MAVSFTPGPHPTSQPSSPAQSSTTFPSAIQHSNLQRSASPRDEESALETGEGDETQPLISSAERRRNRMITPIIVGTFILVVFGVVLGFGGWRLGKGEGGDRWPGGPH